MGEKEIPMTTYPFLRCKQCVSQLYVIFKKDVSINCKRLISGAKKENSCKDSVAKLISHVKQLQFDWAKDGKDNNIVASDIKKIIFHSPIL